MDMHELGGVDDPLEATKLEDIVGLCLSGGGYKAVMFHAGALARLNELGALRKIDRVSSVSGGSIAAGLLAIRWQALDFEDGIARGFQTEILAPLIRLCLKANIDQVAIAGGVLSPFERAVDKVEAAYDKWLYKGASLSDLPDEERGKAPRFVFNATNVALNTLERFSKAHVRDHRVGEWANPDLPLARIVAASSAFPPVLSPLAIMPPRPLSAMVGADRNHAPYNERLDLCDGGAYDNLGIETIWKRCRTILVSNAGDPFDETPSPPDDWGSQLRRTVSMIHRQAENNRMRMLILLARGGHRTVALWNLRARPAHPALSLDEAGIRTAQNTKVRLKPMRREEAIALMRHGYAMCDASVGAFWMPDNPRAKAFPDYLKA